MGFNSAFKGLIRIIHLHINYTNHHQHHHHHHHHLHLANMKLSHLVTRSYLAHPEVSSMFFLRFFCLFVRSFFITLGNLLKEAFCLHAYRISSVVLYFVQTNGSIYSIYVHWVYLHLHNRPTNTYW